MPNAASGWPCRSSTGGFCSKSGTGPARNYGIRRPEDSATGIAGLCDELEGETGTRARPADPFPLTSADLRQIDERVVAGDRRPWAERLWPSGGCLPICDQGCTSASVLILAGEFAGRVWDVACFVGYDGEWLPARRPPGWWEFGMPHPAPLPPLIRPPTFEEWYEGWLDRCVTDLARSAGQTD